MCIVFFLQVRRIEGTDMAPTLNDKDQVVINKVVYRIRHPRRGDIVMVDFPLKPERSLTERVVAEGGDTVRITDGRVYVNDAPFEDDYYVAPAYRSHDDYQPHVVPTGYFFVMGDHRNGSSDSRHWGAIPEKYIIGKVALRW